MNVSDNKGVWYSPLALTCGKCQLWNYSARLKFEYWAERFSDFSQLLSTRTITVQVQWANHQLNSLVRKNKLPQQEGLQLASDCAARRRCCRWHPMPRRQISRQTSKKNYLRRKTGTKLFKHFFSFFVWSGRRKGVGHEDFRRRRFSGDLLFR